MPKARRWSPSCKICRRYPTKHRCDQSSRLERYFSPEKIQRVEFPDHTVYHGRRDRCPGRCRIAEHLGLQDCAETINEFASDEQKAKYLPRVCAGETCAMDLTEPDAGSDLQAVQLKATYNEADGQWYLNGVNVHHQRGRTYFLSTGPFGSRDERRTRTFHVHL